MIRIYCVRLKKYLIERIPKKLEANVNINERNIEFKYNINIYDKYGKEEFNSINDLHRYKFSNDIKRIDINLSTGYQLVEIRLSFGPDILFSALEVDALTENGKEISYGISQEIEKLLKENQTIHSFFHGVYAGCMYGVFLIAAVAGFITTIEQLPYHIDFIIMFIFLFGIAYLLIRVISPYSTFNTKNNENINKLSKWLVNGLAGVFLFGVAASYSRGLIYYLF